jgi:hypothetical protein
VAVLPYRKIPQTYALMTIHYRHHTISAQATIIQTKDYLSASKYFVKPSSLQLMYSGGIIVTIMIIHNKLNSLNFQLRVTSTPDALIQCSGSFILMQMTATHSTLPSLIFRSIKYCQGKEYMVQWWAL